MNKLEKKNLEKLNSISNFEIISNPDSDIHNQEYQFIVRSPNDKQIAFGVLNFNNSKLGTIINRTNYNEGYLKRKLIHEFKNSGLEEEDFIITLPNEIIKSYSILTIKLENSNSFGPGDYLTLEPTHFYYALDNNAILCQGRRIRYRMEVKFIQTITSTCQSFSGRNPDEEIEYSRVQVDKIYS